MGAILDKLINPTKDDVKTVFPSEKIPLQISVDEGKGIITLTRSYSAVELSESDLKVVDTIYNNIIKNK